ERSIKEMSVREFGPVTFPAYQSATASVRSLTDEFLLDALMREPERLQALLDYRESILGVGREEEDAPSEDAAPVSAPRTERRDSVPLYGMDHEYGKEPWRL